MKSESTAKQLLRRLSKSSLYDKTILPFVKSTFYMEIIRKTGNFTNMTWLGKPIIQSVSDLWVIQEAIYEVKPALLIETGTNQGGSSYFYAQLFDLMGHGRIMTVDIEKLHDLSHPRIEYLIGSSVDPKIVQRMSDAVEVANGPVMVILDSDHSEKHVSAELEVYHSFVTTGSYMMVQDGSIDASPIFQELRPGPLPAIQTFLKSHAEFVVDRQKCEKFVVTHHPMGWMKKIESPSSGHAA